MARIISGATSEDVGRFYLAGVQRGQETAEREKARALKALELFHEKAAEAEKERALVEKERAKQLKEQKHAQQMGLASRAQGIANEVAAGKRTPTQQMLDVGIRARAKMDPTDEKALKAFDDAFASVVKAQDRMQRFNTAAEMVMTDFNNKKIDETQRDDYLNRLKTKFHGNESPDDIQTEITKARMDRAAKAHNEEENAKAYEEVRRIYDELPEGEGKRMLGVEMKGYEERLDLQGEAGSASRVLRRARQELARQEPTPLDEQPAPGLGGMSIGQMKTELGSGKPNIPPLDKNYRDYARKQRKELERRYGVKTTEAEQHAISQALNAPTKEGVYALLREQGADLSDPETKKKLIAFLDNADAAYQ